VRFNSWADPASLQANAQVIAITRASVGATVLVEADGLAAAVPDHARRRKLSAPVLATIQLVISDVLPRQVFIQGQTVALAGFIEGYQTMPYGSDHENFFLTLR